MAKTGAQKQSDRMNPLNAAARAAGFDGWRNYETAVIKGFPLIDKNSEFAPDLEAQTPIQLSNSRRCSKCGTDSGQAHYGADHTIYCIEHCPNCTEPEPAPDLEAPLGTCACGATVEQDARVKIAGDKIVKCPECAAKRDGLVSCYTCKRKLPKSEMGAMTADRSQFLCPECMAELERRVSEMFKLDAEAIERANEQAPALVEYIKGQPAPDTHLDDRGE